MLASGSRSVILVALALAGAVLSGLPGTEPDDAKARKSYGGRGYKKPSHRSQVASCRKTCGKARRTCVYCAKQDGREQLAACAAQATPGAGKRACKQAMKSQVRAAAQACKGLKGQCKGCCAANYAGDCNASFSGTPGYPSYFRTVTHYGKKHHYSPDCQANDSSSGSNVGSGSDCLGNCDRQAAAVKCGKRDHDAGAAAAEAARQQCRATCDETTTTTTTTTPTTTTLPTTASCATLNCDQYDTLCVDSVCQGEGAYAYCAYAPKTPPSCDDGDACNGYESFDCITGCHSGTPYPCEEYSDLCTRYTCSSSFNQPYCNPETLTQPTCDDGNACNGYETFDCKIGCVPGAGDPCVVYNNFCYHSDCTSIGNAPSCSYDPLPQPTCDDSDACNGTESFDCQQGQCVSGPPVFCPPGQHCVNDPPGIVCELN